jgi:uncharacterized protein with HEPN domain
VRRLHPLRTADYLQHMAQAIDNIQSYTVGMDAASFKADRKTQDAVIRNMEIVGEAANNIQRVDPSFAAAHAHIPWQVMYTMRNRLTHGYEKVDLEIVWKTIHNDLPVLYKQIKALSPSV